MRDEYWGSPTTGNVFQVEKEENGKVLLARIGYYDNAQDCYVPSPGIGATVTREWLQTSDWIELVHCMGDTFMPAERYYEQMYDRSE